MLKKKPVWPSLKSFPSINVVFAAYNEEAVIKSTIENLLKSNYPKDKLAISVGSDCSSDKTNEILRELAAQNPQLKPVYFKERQGKSSILNQLTKKADSEYLLLMDANIQFEENTIMELAQTLEHEPETGAVGGNIQYFQNPDKGISKQEGKYLNLENRLKHAESKLLKLCMGLEGGCYLIRRELFPTIPPLFFMEDFFVSLHVLQKGHKLRFNPRAAVREDISTQAQEEYKRKFRISIGNFQNLGFYQKLIWQKFWPIGFSFLMHKVLRWLSPIFMLLLIICSISLFKTHAFFALFSDFYFLFLSLGIFGILFSQQRGLHFLKFPGHFLYMNIALFDGFLTYLKGVKSNAWQPTKRNQH